MKRLLLLLALLIVPAAMAIPYEKTVSLHDLGVLQLAAHDLFNVDREAEIDFENGKLDLTTLFDYGEENIILGGEPRNRENIILATVAQGYGTKYHRLVDRGISEERAKKKVIRKYHRDVKKAYYSAFSQRIRRPRTGEVGHTHNLALRTIHDFLPGTIVVNGKEVPTLDFSLHGKSLSRRELRQRSGPLDGKFDPAFRNITVFIPPNSTFTIDLFERDSSFADQFDTDFSFEHFMEELEDHSYQYHEDVMKHIAELFHRGLKLD